METNHYFTNAQIDALVAAGHNVICNRVGIDDGDETLALAQRCDAKGVFYAPWTRWTKQLDDADNEFTLLDGTVTGIASPYSTSLWSTIESTVTDHAVMTASASSMWGLFADLEIYTTDLDDLSYQSSIASGGSGYATCYSQQAMEHFAFTNEIICPVAAGEDREAWLEGENLHDEYKAWLAAYYLTQFESLLDTVLTHTDQFHLAIWSAANNPFVRAAVTAWQNKGLPDVIVMSSSYGPDENTLMAELQDLYTDEASAAATWHGYGAKYVTGLTPYRTGGQYRSPYAMACAARMGIEAADGYWIWFEGQDAIDRTQDYHDDMAVVNKDDHWTDKLVKIWG